MLVLAVVSRLWALGARVMSHDESLHVYYSWLLASGKGYAHNPMMHGPFLFEATALMNVLFGASDFTSRLVPVILGIFVAIFVPQLLKPWLGRFGSLAASGLLLISPFVLYYSRYIRHDMQVIAWLLLAVVAVWRYLENRHEKHLILLAIALSLMISTMEISFIYLAILAGYLLLRAIYSARLSWKKLILTPEFDLIVVLSTLGAFLASPIALLVLNPIWTRLTGAPFVELKILDTQALGWTTGGTGLHVWGLLVAFWIGAAVVGLWWGGRRWLRLAGLFLAITATLFTTFWTNPAGLGTGFVGSLGYWLSQQGVARGTQPWYYYGIILPIYEYLPLIGGFLAGVYYLIKRKHLSGASRSFIPFVIWWAAMIFLGLSLAGEKMPWLSTHITIPFILLTAWWIGRLIEGEALWDATMREKWVATISRGAGFTLVGILTFLTVRTSTAVNYVNFDYSTEWIDYAHGAPGVKWVLDDIAEISNHTGIGRDIKIAYDSDVSWPMTWYLRNYPNQAFYGEQPNRQALDAPVVIAGPKNWDKVETILRDRYHRFEVIRMWWPVEDYKNLNWDRIRYIFLNADMRSAIWDILWDRDYRRYAELAGQQIDPPTAWPLSDRMRVYVKKEIVAQMMSMSLGNTILDDLSASKDEYAALRKDLKPIQSINTGGLNAPRGIAIGTEGALYVADTGNSRILKYDRQGNLVSAFGSRTPEGQSPPEPGTFNEPWGIAVDAAGNIFVADTWNHRIQKFDANGKLLLAWGSPGQLSEGPDRLWGPRGIAISPDGKVYVTDTGNKRVAVFDMEGKFLTEFGSTGEEALNEPVGIAVGADGEVYIADTWNLRVAVFSPDGQFQSSWPVKGWLSDSLDNKPFLAIDGDGRVYVTDPEGYQVIAFTKTGEPLLAFGQYGGEQDTFGLPVGIATEPDGAIWVSDAVNGRLNKFSTP
jgi:uncharacterized protein (TIGR03663 family)